MQKKLRRNNVFEVVIIVILLLLIVFAFGVNMLFYKDSAAPKFLGKYYVYVTDEENMDGIKKDSAVICDGTAIGNLQLQNVVLASVNDDNDKAVLRIVGMDDATYTLRSDYSETDDSIIIPKQNVLALCRWTSGEFGKFVMFATSNAGIVLLIVLPCTIIVLLQAVRILDKDNNNSDTADEKNRKAREKEKAKRNAEAAKKNRKSAAESNDDDNRIYRRPEVIKTVDEEEYAEVQKNVEAKIAAAEKIYAPEPEKEPEIPDTPEPVEEPVEEPVSIPEPEPVEEPVSVPEPEPIEEPAREISVSESVEELLEEISSGESVKEPERDVRTEPVRKPSAPKKKKPSSSANKYSSNKYTSNAVRRSTHKTSVDDLLKTIDSEKSRHHK